MLTLFLALTTADADAAKPPREIGLATVPARPTGAKPERDVAELPPVLVPWTYAARPNVVLSPKYYDAEGRVYRQKDVRRLLLEDGATRLHATEFERWYSSANTWAVVGIATTPLMPLNMIPLGVSLTKLAPANDALANALTVHNGGRREGRTMGAPLP